MQPQKTLQLFFNLLSTFAEHSTCSLQSAGYVVEEFSAESQDAIISWDHYLTT